MPVKQASPPPGLPRVAAREPVRYVFVGKRAKAGAPFPSRPSVARVYDYLLGGKDNFSVDRSHGQWITATVPEVSAGVRAQRALLRRVVRYLVADEGIDQLLDVGAGLPTNENVHQIAQGIDPSVRVVYVDNDPVVVAHGKAMLAENPATVVVEGDLRVPGAIISHPLVRTHLDWTRPIGLLLSGVLHLVMDFERPAELTAALIRALPSGSYVFIQHLLDLDDPAAVQLREFMTRSFGRVQFRSLEQVRDLFDGLELVAPGLVRVPDWRPGEEDASVAEDRLTALGLACAGVARKP